MTYMYARDSLGNTYNGIYNHDDIETQFAINVYDGIIIEIGYDYV